LQALQPVDSLEISWLKYKLTSHDKEIKGNHFKKKALLHL